MSRGELLREKINSKISYAGMAELADALDSGSVTSVSALTACYKSRLGELLRVKMNSENFICGYGGIGRRARFRF